MRLTLRTLLAYLDDILEPADAESIGQKIHDSEFATQLVARIRDVTRRLRLGAPKPHGRGLGMDANTVAEYLDNTLPAERIPEFERICLESDAHLAEVAASHQILTLALGTPAEVPPESRQRMYAILNASQTAPAPNGEDVGVSVYDTAVDPSPPETHAVEVETAATRSARPKPEVPDYLREKRSSSGRLLSIVAAVVIVLLLGGVVYQAVSRLELWQVATLSPEQPPAAEDESAEPEAADAANVGGVMETEPAASDATPPAIDVPSDTVEPSVTESPPAEPVESMPVAESPEPAAAPTGPTVVPSIDPSVESEEPVATDVAPSPPLDPTETAPVAPADDSGEIPLVTTPGSGPANEVPDTAEPGAAVAPARDVNGIGRRVATGRDIMLRWDRQARQWQQLPAADILYAGDYLLTLPAYRSSLTLGVGANVQLFGPARMGLEVDESGRIPGIVMDYGRALILSAGRADAELSLTVGERRATLAFGAGETTLAVEVRPRLQSGIDPSEQPAPLEADLYVISGELTWRDAGGAEVKLAAPAHEVLLGDAALVAADAVAIPEWATGVAVERPIDQRAANSIRDNLKPDRDIVLNLKELATDRRPEVVSLAARALGYLDEFGPLVESLSDSEQHAFWQYNVATLNDALGRGVETAGIVREAFVKQRGEDGAQLYRLLYGYNAGQLQNGAAAELVELLDHEDLDCRVLAITNLAEITGSTNFYRPEKSPQDRQSQVQRWRQKLATGEIVPKPK